MLDQGLGVGKSLPTISTSVGCFSGLDLAVLHQIRQQAGDFPAAGAFVGPLARVDVLVLDQGRGVAKALSRGGVSPQRGSAWA